MINDKGLLTLETKDIITFDAKLKQNIDTKRCAKLNSFSSPNLNTLHSVKIGDMVDIKCLKQVKSRIKFGEYGDWIVAQNVDIKDRQVKVRCQYAENKIYQYWTHLDNKNEIAAWRTHTKPKSKVYRTYKTNKVRYL